MEEGVPECFCRWGRELWGRSWNRCVRLRLRSEGWRTTIREVRIPGGCRCRCISQNRIFCVTGVAVGLRGNCSCPRCLPSWMPNLVPERRSLKLRRTTSACTHPLTSALPDHHTWTVHHQLINLNYERTHSSKLTSPLLAFSSLPSLLPSSSRPPLWVVELVWLPEVREGRWRCMLNMSQSV